MKYLSKYHRNNFLLLSVIIALIDILFVLVSINSARQSLNNSIEEQAIQIKQSYQTVLEQAATDMSLMGTFIAGDERVNHILKERWKAEQRGEIDHTIDEFLRQRLMNHMMPAWQMIQDEFYIKSLQIFLPPDSNSFLRLQQPSRFDDSVVGIRNTVSQVLATGDSISGYEIGRTSAALRSVVPVTSEEDNAVVAALDLGTPLSNLLQKLESNIGIGSGVTLRTSALAQSMWIEFQEDYHRLPYVEKCLCVIEYQSEPIFSGMIRQITESGMIKPDYRFDVIQYEGRPYNVVQLPIVDYQNEMSGLNEEVGKVFFWKDATPLHQQYQASVHKTIGWGILGYIFAEIIILWAFVASIKNLELEITGHTENLEESQNNLIEAQRIANIGSWSLNMETESLYWSEQIYHIFELDPEEYEPSYQLFLDMIHPEDRVKVDRAFRESLENNTPFYVSHRLQMADGRIKHVIEEGKTLFDSDGKADVTVGAVRDITDTYLAQEKEKLAASVFQHANEGIFICNEKLDVIEVNEACYMITGVSSDDSREFNLLEYQNRFMNQEQFSDMRSSLVRTGEWNGEVWLKRTSGEEVALDLNISSIRNEHGKVTHYVGLFSDITIKKKHEERLNYIAHFDSLTGLPNRILLTDRLTQAMLQTERSKQYIAILFLDLDGFKKINDNYGHQVGDLMLEHVSEQFTNTIRAGDTVARFGGDEFVFVIQNVARPCAYDIPISRVLEAVAVPMVHEGHTLHVSASIGITFYPQPGKELGADELFIQADTAMYKAKAAGKNGFRIFDENCVQES
ncbi:diguanylate cyclase [Vibrio sp. SCSIO 43132]|uniref:diguanylate cyclase domain-containing protein n=1 Tax=Vibrio sp. SCSIO 43132 TaxID=2779363 RepID=UPI001CA96542|nr:diguanylate cyclase [Vibrio sp. SCSIO 43132]UAB72272.1 diguanylate cyclase [Vibrio sp. SCSIO 43132]